MRANHKNCDGDFMNYGKLSGDVYERSIVKVIKAKTSETREIYDGAEMGNFCAVFPCGENTRICAQASASGRHAAIRAYRAALNSIAARCGACAGGFAVLSLLVPGRLREIKVRELTAEAVRQADSLHFPILNVNVQVLPWVDMPTAVCMADAAGTRADLPDFAGGFAQKRAGASPGEYIVMTKWIGLEGTAVIAESSREKLKARYPSDIVEEAADFWQYGSILSEAATAAKSGASCLHAAREGGIFGGLWELAADNSVGLVADLKSIPVRQETIEVCEYFDLNPYELMAGGSLLITCADGNAMVRALESEGIAAAVIGMITEGNDRLVRHKEESRFLEPVRGDEVYKFYERFRMEDSVKK